MLSCKTLKKGSTEAIANYAQNQKKELAHQSLNSTTKAGYYAKDNTPSEWWGKGAQAIGRQHDVDREAFIAVLDGKLSQDIDLSDTHPDRQLGIDLTFSAPKSVSLMALVGEDQRIVAIHDEAVKQALSYLEQNAVHARLGKGGKTIEMTGNMIAAIHRHEDSRPVDGVVDPQLHSHCIVANATQRADGKWVAINFDFGENAVRMHTADAIYKSVLAQQIQSLGYSIERTEDGFELSGIAKEAIREFSARKQQIDDTLAQRGLSRDTATAQERTLANLATRTKKNQPGQLDQHRQWHERAEVANLQLQEVKQNAVDNIQTPAVEDVNHADIAVQSALAHLSERQSVFSKEATFLEALKAGIGRAHFRDIEQVMGTSNEIINKDEDRITTREAVRREEWILDFARQAQGDAPALMDREQARVFLSEREQRQGYPYSQGQKAAMQLGLTTQDRVVGIVGAAGAGKTTAMQGVVEASQTRGYRVVGIAPSTAAAQELQSAGADDTRTIASFILANSKNNIPRLVIMDEAGMVSAKDMEAVMQKLSPMDRLVLVGDPRQLASVEAGSPFAQLMQTKTINFATIDEIQRQRDPQLRDIAQHFATGRALEAVALAESYMVEVKPIPTDKDEKGNPKISTEDRREAIATQTAQSYLSRSTEDQERTMIVSGTNIVRQKINDKVRDGLQAQGHIGQDLVNIQALDKSDMTREKRKQAHQYREGQVLRITEGKGTQTTTKEYTITKVDGTLNTLTIQDRESNASRTVNPAELDPKFAQVYNTRDMALAAGDHVLFRENNKAIGIKNGMTGNILALENEQIIVQVGNRNIQLDPTKSHMIDYGWARTIHASQGQTIDRVIVAGEANRVASAQTAYVACSRERLALEVVTDSKEGMSKRWGQWAHRETARYGLTKQEPTQARLEHQPSNPPIRATKLHETIQRLNHQQRMALKTKATTRRDTIQTKLDEVNQTLGRTHQLQLAVEEREKLRKEIQTIEGMGWFERRGSKKHLQGLQDTLVAVTQRIDALQDHAVIDKHQASSLMHQQRDLTQKLAGANTALQLIDQLIRDRDLEAIEKQPRIRKQRRSRHAHH